MGNFPGSSISHRATVRGSSSQKQQILKPGSAKNSQTAVGTTMETGEPKQKHRMKKAGMNKWEGGMTWDMAAERY